METVLIYYEVHKMVVQVAMLNLYPQLLLNINNTWLVFR